MDSDKKIAEQIVSGVINFLKKRKKDYLITSVISELHKFESTKRAVVFAPTNLKESEKKNVLSVISKLTGEKIESVDFRLDESLIDGLKIIYDDRLWDFSLSSQLKNITKS